MTKGTNKPSILFIVLLLIIAVSCDSNSFYADSHEMDNEIWRIGDAAVFEPVIDDTTHSNNILFTIRTGTSYPYRNIWLFVSTTSPSGKRLTDTLRYDLADEKGNWFGRGFGDIHELNLPFRSSVFFPEKGKYTFRIIHGMRDEDLKGIYDFGLRIEKQKN